jgi:hypothetical protein
MKTRLLKVFLIVVLSVGVVLPTLPVRATGQYDATSSFSQSNELPDFDDFVSFVSDGTSGVVRGVYVPGLFAFRVVQQSPGNDGYVSPAADAITQFSMAGQYGVTGLLAHNYLVGSYFKSLKAGQEIRIVYGDGRVAYYQVSTISRYQAVSPLSVTSNFIDLATGTEYSAQQTFMQFYAGNHHVTFQTCIAKGNEPSWGRLFVVAHPIPAPLETSPLMRKSN